MKDKVLQIRVDDTTLNIIRTLKELNGFKSDSATVRHLIHKAYAVEKWARFGETYGSHVEFTPKNGNTDELEQTVNAFLDHNLHTSVHSN